MIRRNPKNTINTRNEQKRKKKENSPLLVLNLGLDIVNGIGRLDFEGDRLSRKGLDEDLHLGVTGGKGGTVERVGRDHIGTVQSHDFGG